MALADNLVSYWKLDEASGNAADAVGSNTLTNVGTTTFAAAKINNGAVLNGSSKYFTIADASQTGLDFAGNLTFSIWINLSAYTNTTFYPLVNKINFGDAGGSRAYCFGLNFGGTAVLSFSCSDGATFTTKSVSWTPSTSTWYHLMCVYTAAAGTVDFYVNGSLQGAQQSGLPTSITNTARAFSLGAAEDGGSFVYFLPATIDEAGVWSRSLTSTEVTSLYNAGSGLQYPFGATSVNSNFLRFF